MPQVTKKRAKGIPKRATSNKGRCSKFFTDSANRKRHEKKAWRVYRSSGLAAAQSYAKKYDCKLKVKIDAEEIASKLETVE